LITIISGTNRKGSISLKVAKIYEAVLKSQSISTNLLSLEQKEVWRRGEEMLEIESQLLIPAEKFIFVMPEYNASFPGILKVMMDNCDIKKVWWHKKALLTGLSEGRAGNIRGIEHMTSILNYLKVNVHYNKMLLSKIKEEIDGEGNLIKPDTMAAIETQVAQFISF
jgi:chromate reductase, NAD(P)H dehydrogenase (quinone)